MPIDAIVNTIIQQSRRIDPAIADAFIALSKEMQRISNLVDPAPITQSKVSESPALSPVNVTEGGYTLGSTTVTLYWTAPTTDIILYEIRQGSAWDTATRITVTGSLQLILDPLAVGTTKYLVKSLSSSGIYSLTPFEIDVLVPAIGSFNITTSQINTSVLLTWDAPTSTFDIAHYIVTKGGSEVGTVTGTFVTFTESAGGNVTYGVKAVDIYGNTSNLITVLVVIPTPADFQLQNFFTSAFSGTLTNVMVEAGPPAALLAAINTTETYQQHFVNNGWASPQAQVTAGYTNWLSPSAGSASYKEVFDCGSILTNTIIGLSWAYNLLSGSFTIATSTRVSDNNVTWSAANTNATFFVTSVRYIEVTITFTPGTNKSLLEFYNFFVSASVKRELDAGNVAALSTDALGTVVTFNKTFKDVDSVTASTESTKEPYTVIVNFVDIPNPTNFTVFVYDTSGIRVSKTVSWKAKGIV